MEDVDPAAGATGVENNGVSVGGGDTGGGGGSEDFRRNLAVVEGVVL